MKDQNVTFQSIEDTDEKLNEISQKMFDSKISMVHKVPQKIYPSSVKCKSKDIDRQYDPILHYQNVSKTRKA